MLTTRPPKPSSSELLYYKQVLYDLDFMKFTFINLLINKTGNVRKNVTFMRASVTIVTVEKQ
jgi:hypothetical protein